MFHTLENASPCTLKFSTNCTFAISHVCFKSLCDIFSCSNNLQTEAVIKSTRVDPLSSNSDQDILSPPVINAQQGTQVRRIKLLITKNKKFHIQSNSHNLHY